MAGAEYSIADMAIWPWYGGVVAGDVYDAAEFMDAASYTDLLRWQKQLAARSAVQRGRRVNDADNGLRERNAASDFDVVEHRWQASRQTGHARPQCYNVLTM